jgi:DNA-binding response OmpR family regulator
LTPEESAASSEILVIDDDVLVLDTIVQVLQNSGYRVSGAADGREGIAIFRSGHPDLVITDIIMPVKEGIEVIRAIRRERPAVKIIAISGGGRGGNLNYLEMARAMGANDVIAKPFDADELVERVQVCLATNH